MFVVLTGNTGNWQNDGEHGSHFQNSSHSSVNLEKNAKDITTPTTVCHIYLIFLPVANSP